MLSARLLVRQIAITTTSALVLCLAGCQTGGTEPEAQGQGQPEAAAANPRVLTETAPTASEMEHAIAPVTPPQEGGDKQPLRIEMAAPTQNGSRPKAPLPPITANPSPFVDEVTTMPTRELHGYAFPGTEAIQPPQMTELAANATESKTSESAASDAAIAAFEQRKQQAEVEAKEAEAAAEAARQRAAAAIAAAEEATNKARETDGARVQQAAADAQRKAEAARAATEAAEKERAEAVARAEEARKALAVETEKAELAAREAQERSRVLIAEAEAAAKAAREEADQQIAAENARAEAARQSSASSVTAAAATTSTGSDAPLLETVPAGGTSAQADAWEPVDESFYTPPSGPYQIGAGDILELKVFNDPTLDREVTVRYDGNVSLPLMADIDVEGLTREEAERQIRESYSSVFRNPQLSLLVKQTTSKTFVVIGDIETPGVYPYLRPTTLIEGISLAGGLRKRNSSSSTGGFVGVTGQLTKAFVVRHREGERMVVQFDLRELGSQGAHSADAPLYPGDLIYVPEGVNLVYLLGESANPVIVELTEGMTLLQMLSLSGGFNASTARLRNVVLMRQVDSENTRVMSINVREILRTGRDIPLSPGDIIYIPQKWTVRLSEFVGRFTGSISPVLDMYNSAVEAYYGADLARRQLNSGQVSRTLQRLTDIEQFGTSTSNIVNLFGAP